MTVAVEVEMCIPAPTGPKRLPLSANVQAMTSTLLPSHFIPPPPPSVSLRTKVHSVKMGLLALTTTIAPPSLLASKVHWSKTGLLESL
jgi:hypothetical protein